ncbi:hypothetical protein F5Y17DRAFT_208387 [Xylariaceae sp. FL0594]|nr:hypothetical protein F5Y17DRAFT_208387 [Xylariaceae sp. FL0594]
MDGDRTNKDRKGGNGHGDGDGGGLGERGKVRDSDTTNNSDSHVSHTPAAESQSHQQQQQQQQPTRSKLAKRVVGGATARLHARVPSSKGLNNKQLPQLAGKSSRRAVSPDPEPSPMLANTHRRATSELKLTQSDQHNLHSNNTSRAPSQSNLATRRNKSHIEVGKRPKAAANIKRSSSNKDVNKLKGPKNQVHFDLGLDDEEEVNDDEWVDASASASPYLSRRGSVVSGGQQSPAKPPSSVAVNAEGSSRPQTPRSSNQRGSSPSRQQTIEHSNYITSRLLGRVPSHGAPPQMSTETVTVAPSGSPISQASHGVPSLYGTPKTGALGASGSSELVSRFVDGSGAGSSGRTAGDYFAASHAEMRRNEGIRSSQSLSNLQASRRGSVSDEDDGSALVPRSRRTSNKATPASQSRTQQKLNLQRASSTIEPGQAGPGGGVIGPSLLVGSSDYEHRDPRINKLLERTGMEYLVVRRYQNPIARSLARLSHLQNVNKNKDIAKQSGSGTTRPKDSIDLAAAGRLGPNRTMADAARSRPSTPRRSTSIRTTGARSSYDGGDDERFHDRVSGSSYVESNDDGLAAALRNIWDKSTDLGSSQE